MELCGSIVDVVSGRIFLGRLRVEQGVISEIAEDDGVDGSVYILPGFVDAHVHIESSMLAPSEFARVAPIHGTVATVSDPHEIANVLGVEGVKWMIANAEGSSFKFFFGAPSCVPATPFETAGAVFGVDEVRELLDTKGIYYLAEVMNFPAVIGRDSAMMSIVNAAVNKGLPVDGHAPGVIGEDLKKYATAGIQTDHECVREEEGAQRIALGMKVAIREGSAARNFDALWPLLKTNPESCFFCSDDKHPDDLVVSHIDELLRRSVSNGIDVMDAIRVATLNPVMHYGLNVGLLQEGDPADIVEVDDLSGFKVRRCWVDGNLAAESGQTKAERRQATIINRFNCSPKEASAFHLKAEAERARVIVAEDGQLVTGAVIEPVKIEDGYAVSDTERDILKIAVVNRYEDAAPRIGFIRNFGLKGSAIASTVAHDSHNIVAVGATDELLCRAVNSVIDVKGGLSFVSEKDEKCIPLPIAGLMSDGDAWEVADAFTSLNTLAWNDGCGMRSPYMTLSFMALLVIPKLKIGDQGLFDVDVFSLVDLWDK